MWAPRANVVYAVSPLARSDVKSQKRPSFDSLVRKWLYLIMSAYIGFLGWNQCALPASQSLLASEEPRKRRRSQIDPGHISLGHDSQEWINYLTMFVSHLKRPLLSWPMASVYVIVGGYCAILAPHVILLGNFSALIRSTIIWRKGLTLW